MAYTDPEQRRAYKRGWYKRNAAKVKAEVRDRKRKLARQLREYKEERGCTYCPEDSFYCLDFHHINSDKEFNVSKMVSNGYSWDKILQEINKCVLVCANCHRKLHAGEVLVAA